MWSQVRAKMRHMSRCPLAAYLLCAAIALVSCSQPTSLQKSAREESMAPLVYDIGLHNGGDTRQYLKEGCRVIAIDANPAMCAAAVAEFQRHIDTKRLTVLS